MEFYRKIERKSYNVVMRSGMCVLVMFCCLGSTWEEVDIDGWKCVQMGRSRKHINGSVSKWGEGEVDQLKCLGTNLSCLITWAGTLVGLSCDSTNWLTGTPIDKHHRLFPLSTNIFIPLQYFYKNCSYIYLSISCMNYTMCLYFCRSKYIVKLGKFVSYECWGLCVFQLLSFLALFVL
jgi:hypothetical protein